MKRILMLFFSIAFLFSILSVNAILDCSLVTDAALCGVEQTVYKMNDTNNAHAGTVGVSTYQNEWCCRSPRDEGQQCSATNVVISLSASDDAHVEEKGFTTDGYTGICFGDVECRYELDCSALDPYDYDCVGSMEQTTNSHVGDCNAYTTKICCRDNCLYPGEDKVCVYDLDCCSGYCSSGADENLPAADWRCCDAGTYWDPGSGTCREAAECGIFGTVAEEGEGYCFADITADLAGWLADPDCHRYIPKPLEQGCCSVDRYGETDYYFDDVVVYT